MKKIICFLFLFISCVLAQQETNKKGFILTGNTQIIKIDCFFLIRRMEIKLIIMELLILSILHKILQIHQELVLLSLIWIFNIVRNLVAKFQEILLPPLPLLWFLHPLQAVIISCISCSLQQIMIFSGYLCQILLVTIFLLSNIFAQSRKSRFNNSKFSIQF